ncbi:amidohydrolase [Muricauda oceani]|uniref:Amidohydrolase n=1 Tax=Flagellimonas oceani TaxID=2698672 RepID=A0A6G7IZB1_9FLAO|nr:amidohydrolase [Allomuricauda oceani]MBW8244802.1 amidohydrolase [Allomuricauda oceani]QII43886.1 amidohydrolase [Allomuricauda oceani]
MKKSKILVLLLFTFLIISCKKKKDVQKETADLIVFNAKVATEVEGTFAEAFAVKDGNFLKIGTSKAILELIGDDSRVIDATGKTVIPGLNDSHTHLIREGLNYNSELRWDGVRSIKEALNMLKEQADRTPDGQWIRVVGGWGEHQFEEKRLPTLQEINEAVPDHPVYVLYLYSYGYLNQKGIETLGYDSETHFPGGEVQLENGKPTGFLVAKPSALLLYKTLTQLPKLTPEEQVNSTLHFYRELNRLGVTSAIDAGGGGQYYTNDYKIAKQLASEGKLTVRTSYYLFAVDKGTELSFFKKWADTLRSGSNDDMFKPNGYTFMGAGENLTWEAADFENFLEPRPELKEIMETELDSIVTLLAKNKWPFRIHATYNESITRFLDVFEKVDQKYPFLNRVRWIIDHAETIDDTNIQRIKKMGGGIALQNRMFFQGEYFVDRYGAEQAKQTPSISKIIHAGIPLGLGTDGTRVSSYNPMLALYWAITGKTWGGLQLYDEDNRLSRHKALELMTHGSAWFSNEESAKGYIKEGMYADFAILSDDYFTIPEEDIKELTSDLTVVNGTVVFAKNEFKALDPPMPEVIPNWSPVKYFGGYQH